jgi:hypothetical protein
MSLAVAQLSANTLVAANVSRTSAAQRSSRSPRRMVNDDLLFRKQRFRKQSVLNTSYAPILRSEEKIVRSTCAPASASNCTSGSAPDLEFLPARH